MPEKVHNLKMVWTVQAFTTSLPYLHTYTSHPWFYTYEGEDEEPKAKD